MTLVIPLLAIYAETFNATPLQATLLVTVFAACQLVSGPLIGHASDRTGRKPMLIMSQVGTFIGFIVLARASALWMIFLSRMIDGATAGNLSLAQAYIADNTTPENRARSFGLIGIAFGLGFFIGPSLTGSALGALWSDGTDLPGGRDVGDERAGYGNTVAWRASDGGAGRRSMGGASGSHTYAQYFARPRLRSRLFQFLFFMLSFSMFISGFALFAERRFMWNGHPFGPREIGYVFGGVGLFGIFLQGALIGRLVKRFGEAPLVLAGFFSAVVGYLMLGWVTSTVPLIIAAVLSGFGNGVLRPALTSLITHQAERHEQGVVLGISQALTSMASIVAPDRGRLPDPAPVAVGMGLDVRPHGGHRLGACADSTGYPEESWTQDERRVEIRLTATGRIRPVRLSLTAMPVTVITGGSAGIGAATAALLVSRGHRVVMAARDEARLREAAAPLGEAARAVVADVTRRADVERLRDEAIAAFGHVDVWINNAGRGITRPVLELTDEDVTDIIDTNLRSVLYGMQAIVPHFKEREVDTSSTSPPFSHACRLRRSGPFTAPPRLP